MIDSNLYENIKKYVPGGVNSPIRSFKSVGGTPLFIKKGKGAIIYDEENNEYIDYCLSFGPLILGHSHNTIVNTLKNSIEKGTSFGTSTVKELKLARLIVEAIFSIDKVRLTNSGTEAIMTAVRLARAYTKKNKVIKFEGSYHGHVDYLLAKAGSGIVDSGKPDSEGIPGDFTKHTFLCPYNDIETITRIVKKYQNDIATILVEPVMANCGIIIPEKNYLKNLRELANKYNMVLIFDEVITGFRLMYGSAQEYFNIEADLTCLGKIIGGGLPVGAVGGKNRIMNLLAPEGNVYQAGTLSGNPLATTAGITTLNLLKNERPYEQLEEKTKKLSGEMEFLAKKYNAPLKVNNIASLFNISFFKNYRDINKKTKDYNHAKKQDIDMFSTFFHLLLDKNIYLSPSCFESNFLSTEHTNKIIDKTLSITEEVLKKLRRN